MNDAAVSLHGMVKRYGVGTTAVHALRGADLDVGYGELLMLVGPSGCGKTTLISVAAGILDHDEGTVSVLGTDLDRLSGRGLTTFRGKHIGFVFQAFNLVPTLTLVENVAVPLLLLGESSSRAAAAASTMLERVGLGDRRGDYPAQLSGGQQQRVAIARALVHRPRLLVCDEPTSSLDHHTGQMIMALLREIAIGPDRALLIVTHDSRIFSFADRIAHMDDGRVVNIETPTPSGGGKESAP
jgi:putative ABC transport system ATP-binding protein